MSHSLAVPSLCSVRCAPQILKQKKLYESQREQLYQQQFNVEQTRFTVQSVKDTVTTVQVGGWAPGGGGRGAGSG